MTNRVVITIELPEGIVPDVQYSQAPRVSVSEPILTVAPTDQEFPPFPSQASSVPQCKVHSKPMKPGRKGGWYCPTKVGDGWCAEKA